MKFLTEWKNVSDDVIEISNLVISKILDDIHNQTIRYSNINKLPLITNDEYLVIDIKQNNIDQTIKVKYILYKVDNEQEFEWVMKHMRLNLNCEWDEGTKTLTVVSLYIDDEHINMIQQSVIHEMEHMYQYFQGMGKRVDLYDKCIGFYNSNDKIKRIIGVGLYYTFKHEQDAYVQQFYRYLYKYNHEIDIDDALEEYEPFVSLNEVYDMIDRWYDNKNAMKYINELGYSRRDYFKRLKYGYDRLIKKMENAYERWKYENRNKFLNNQNKIQEMIEDARICFKLNENKIKNYNGYFIIEPFYKCFYK